MDEARRSRDERGETLVELLVSLAILGVAAVAILAGVFTSVKTSEIHKNEATGGAYVRSFAEAVQNSIDDGGFKENCTTAKTAYANVPVKDLPSGYVKEVALVETWNLPASPAADPVWGPCRNGDTTQRVTLKVTTSGDATHRATETLVVVLRRPCTGLATAADPCA